MMDIQVATTRDGLAVRMLSATSEPGRISVFGCTEMDDMPGAFAVQQRELARFATLPEARAEARRLLQMPTTLKLN